MAEGIVGTYQCLACGLTWDGSEVYRDPQSMGAARLTCGDLTCGATVRKISNEPKPQSKTN